MSQIRKYTENKWKVFAETNIENTADTIVTRDKVTTVQETLDRYQDDITKLKQNVAWLALHGGGGSGGSDPGGTKKASATILLNNRSSGADISIDDLEDDQIALTVKLTNIRPTKMTSTWSVQVIIEGSVIVAQSISSPSDLVEIRYGKIKKYIYDEQQKKEKSSSIKILATYNDTEIPGEATPWTGKILKSSIHGKITIVGENERNYFDKEDDIKDDNVHVTIQSRLTGSVSLQLSCQCGDTICSYEEDGLQKNDPDDMIVKINFGQFSNYETIKRNPDIYVIQGQIKLTTQSTSIEKCTMNEYLYIMDGDNINGYVENLSKDSQQPTEVQNVYKFLKFNVLAFRTKGQSYGYEIHMTETTKEGGEGEWQSAYKCQRAEYYGVKSYQNVNLGEIFESSKMYKLKITFHDSDDWQFVLKEMPLRYYIKIVNEGSLITYKKDIRERQLFGINYYSGEKFSGHNVKIFSPSNYRGEININRPNFKSGTQEEFIRFQNTCHWVMEDRFYKGESTSPISMHDYGSWVIHIAFRSDTNINDDHIVFAYGESRESIGDSGKLSPGDIVYGISIKTHGVYINNSKVIELQDNTDNIVTIVYSNLNSTSIENNAVWYANTSQSPYGITVLSNVKIYINGILTYAKAACPFETKVIDTRQKINFSNVKFYFGGTPYGQDCACRLYECNCYIGYSSGVNDYINDKDILAMYINSKSILDFDRIQEIQNTELKKNLCTLYKKDNVPNLISSLIVTEDGYFDFSQFFTSSTHLPPITESEYQSQKTTFEYIRSSIDIPIVCIDGSHDTHWTYNDFIASYSDPKSAPTTTGTLYYWPKETTLASVAGNVKISIQGNSTLGVPIKNVDITFNKKEGQNIEDMLFIKPEWIPETTYTLKADIVDSSHSNNASLGKLINDAFREGSGFNYNFSKFASDAMAVTKDSLAFQDATLKHTVEGFPIFLFCKFAQQDGGPTETNPRLLGIYSWNLGRKAYRNLGYKSIKLKDDKVMSYPSFIQDVEYTEYPVPDSRWIETDVNSNIDNDQFAKLDYLETLAISDDFDTGGSGSFWSTTPSMISSKFDVKYSTDSSQEYGSQVTSFMNLADQISHLPIESTFESIIHTFDATDKNGIYGYYANYEMEGKIPVKHDELSVQMKNLIVDTDYNSIDIDHARKYFCIAMLFGMVDNFEKNVSYRIFNDNASDSQWFVDFYDLDTALGLDNGGYESVSPSFWIRYLKNIESGVGESIPSMILKETYDVTQGTHLSTYSYSAPAGRSNKLWLSLDARQLRTGRTPYERYSYYTTEWFNLRNCLDQIVSEFNEKGGVQYGNFVDYFIGEYYDKHTENVGSFLFNYDYRMKYLNLVGPDQQGVSETTSTLEKLHGKRTEYVRKWLKDRIDFLDSLMFARNLSRYTKNENTKPSSLSSNLIYGIKYDAGKNKEEKIQSSEIPVTTNKDIIIRAMGSATNQDTHTLVRKGETVYLPSTIGDTNDIKLYNARSFININLDNFYVKTMALEKPTGDGSKLNEINNISIKNYDKITSFPIDIFYDTNLKSDLTSLTIKNCEFENTHQVNVANFDKLTEIDVENTNNIAIQGYNNLVLTKFKINGSNANDVDLQDQHFISFPNIDNCEYIRNIKIISCDMDNQKPELREYIDLNLNGKSTLESIYLKNTTFFKSIRITNCNKLSSVTIINCPNISSVYLCNNNSLSLDNSVYLVDNDNLQRITLTSEALPSITLDSNHLSNITYFDISYTQIKYISDRYDQHERFTDVDGTVIDVLDVSKMNISKSGSFYAYGYLPTEAIRFKNDIKDPVDKYGVFRSTDSKTQPTSPYYWNMTSLRRVFGHLVIKPSEFHNLSKFSIFGGGYDSLKFGESTITHGTTFPSVLKIDNSYDTHMHVLSTDSKGRNIYSTYCTDGKVNSAIDFVDGISAVNLIPNTATNNYDLGWPLNGTKSTWQDGYYMLHRIASVNAANKKQTVDEYKKYPLIKVLRGLLGNGIKDDDKVIYELPRTLFYGCGDITYLYDMIPGFSKGTVKILSPEDGKDNGLLAPLTSLVTLDFGNTISFDSNVFNTTGRKYKIKEINDMSTTGLTMTTTMFDNTPELTSIIESFNNIYSGQNIRIPTSVTYIYNSFFFKSGYLDPYDICGGKDSGLTSIVQSSFNGDSGTRIIFRPSSFSHLKNLVYIGSSTVNGESTSFGGKATKYIVKDDYNPNETPETPQLYTTADWDVFLSSILSAHTNLQCAPLLFYKAELDNSYYTTFEYETQKLNAHLPGNIFKNTPNIRSVNGFFKDIKFMYALDSESFSNCPRIESCREMFYRTSFVDSVNYGISSEIPYRFFYHGQKTPPYYVQMSGMFENVDYPSFNNHKSNLTASISGSYSTLSDLICVNSKITQAKYNDISSRLSNEFLKIEQFPIYDPEQLQVYQEYRPLVTDDGIKEGCESIVNTLSTFLENTKTYSDWLSNFICLSSTQRIAYNFNRSLYDVSKCFYGNGNIQYYSSSAVIEENEEYNPFSRILENTNPDTKLSENKNVDWYLSSVQWSYNGEISAKRRNEEGEIVYEYTFNENVKNCCSKYDKEIILSTEIEEFMNPIEVTYGSQQYTSYNPEKNDFTVLNFMCSPDLFRYMKNDSNALCVTYMFESTSVPSYIVWKQELYNARGGSLERKGMHGRIPPILLKPISQVSYIDGLFKDCRFISPYYDSSISKKYMIAPQFFSYTKNLKSLKLAFANMLLFDFNINQTFQNIQTSQDRKINIGGIFSGCYFYSVKQTSESTTLVSISNVFNNKYLTNVNHAFSRWMAQIVSDKRGVAAIGSYGGGSDSYTNEINNNRISRLGINSFYNNFTIERIDNHTVQYSRSSKETEETTIQWVYAGQYKDQSVFTNQFKTTVSGDYYYWIER